MTDKYTKGVTIGAEKEEENTRVEDFTREETKAQVLMNEDDYIRGLIAAADFSNVDTQRIEIVRDGRTYFAFNIRPLRAEEYDKCRRDHTKYVRNRSLGMRVPEETNRTKYQSAIIYEATVKEDRDKLWDNKKVWDSLVAKSLPIARGLDVIEYALKAGEKDKIIEAIDHLSGYDENIEEVAKN